MRYDHAMGVPVPDLQQRCIDGITKATVRAVAKAAVCAQRSGGLFGI